MLSVRVEKHFLVCTNLLPCDPATAATRSRGLPTLLPNSSHHSLPCSRIRHCYENNHQPSRPLCDYPTSSKQASRAPPLALFTTPHNRFRQLPAYRIKVARHERNASKDALTDQHLAYLLYLCQAAPCLAQSQNKSKIKQRRVRVIASAAPLLHAACMLHARC